MRSMAHQLLTNGGSSVDLNGVCIPINNVYLSSVQFNFNAVVFIRDNVFSVSLLNYLLTSVSSY